MILTGKEGSVHAGERLLSLVETGSTQVSAGASDVPTVPRINKYLNPNILTGLMIAFFILSIFIFAVLQLFYVQTPTVFTNQAIDFGKIEK